MHNKQWKINYKFKPYPKIDVPPFPVPVGSPVCAIKLLWTEWNKQKL